MVLDNRSSLLKSSLADQMVATEAFGIVAFDPASEIKDAKQYEGSDYIQLFQHALLGDGKAATLHACVAPEMTSTLSPLPPEKLSKRHQLGARLLAELPINTVALDSIEGLGNLDWLILDELSDAITILEHGKQSLTNTLLIQARVSFQPTHEKQPSLAELQHWASRNGFRFYRFHNISHYSHLPEKLSAQTACATEQESGDVLFLPSHERMAILSEKERMKLAFMLSAGFAAHDVAFELIAGVSQEKALEFLEAQELLPKLPAQGCSSGKNIEDLKKSVKSASLFLKKANHTLPGHLVVSLTSYHPRFDNLHLTLRSLLLQSTCPDILILWIAKEERDNIPESVWSLEQFGLKICFCDDLRSYKKIIPTLQKYSDSFIVTADDDLYYDTDWLKELVNSWDGDHKMIVAHRAHKIRVDKKRNPLPYRQWKWQVGLDEPIDGLIFPTSGAGVLWPPHVFYKDVANRKRFMELCPNADDIWLYWMASLNGAKIKRSNYDFRLVEWPSQNSSPLWKKNIEGGGNDRQIKNMQVAYGFRWLESAIEKKSFSVPRYWDQRYKNGGNSGAGSYGRLSEFKAEIINEIIKEKEVGSVIEFGCGDGNQLGLISPVCYLGVDISPTAVKICREKFFLDKDKSFVTLGEFKKQPGCADIALSLDVIYHLIDDEIYHDYMQRLFSSASKYCLIYSANVDEITPSPHVRKRRFSNWVEKNAVNWELEKYIPNRYPMIAGSDPNNTSFADFYLFKRKI